MHCQGRLAAALVVGVMALAGCRAEAPKVRPPAEVESRIEKLQEEAGDVLARRDELSRERQKVDADRAALDEKRKRVAAAGGDVTPVDAELGALREREARLTQDEAALGRKLDSVLRGYQEVTAGGGGHDAIAREAQVAVREKDLARREQVLASRETTLAERERELAKRERETCGAAAAPAAAPAPPVPGSRYTRKDVEPLLSSARRRMSEKGLLASDLPSPARELEREAAGAMSSGDYAQARFAAEQLLGTVESLSVDKAFVMAKIGRLNGTVKGAKLDGDTQRQVDDLFRDATADYGDGNFAAANTKLNRIYGLVR